jgi:hypothetical protein
MNNNNNMEQKDEMSIIVATANDVEKYTVRITTEAIQLRFEDDFDANILLLLYIWEQSSSNALLQLNSSLLSYKKHQSLFDVQR